MLRLLTSHRRALRPSVAPIGPLAAAAVFSVPLLMAALAMPSTRAGAAPASGPVSPDGLLASTTLVINEIDYDQPGTDYDEYVELKNVSSSAVSLTGWSVELVNGNGDTVYDTLNLPGDNVPAGGYYVICFNTTVANCDVDMSPATSNRIQNGAPDAMGLRDSTGALIDAVSYEGSVAPPYVESSGDGLTDDSGVAYGGISRYPDGTDTDVNNTDLSFRCDSPGQPNLSTSSDCGQPQQNTATPTPTDTPTPTPTPAVQGTPGVADLAIDKSASPDPVIAGHDLTYTVTSTNTGPDLGSDVEIADTLPGTVRFVSAAPSVGGSCVTPAIGSYGGTVTCLWPGLIDVGAQRSVEITVSTCPEEGCRSDALANTAVTRFDVPVTPEPPPPSRAADIFISEYVEGSSNNKVLEFYNGTGTEIDLAAGGYQVEYYFNGSTSAGATISLTGAIASGGTHVLAHSSSFAEVLAVADQTAGGGWFNGDDAIVLRKGGAGGQILDSIGQIGVDPGSYWGTKPISTQDNTLRRRADICAGDTDPSDDFEPNLDAATGEWDGYDRNTFDGLGTHTANCACGGFSAELFISEYVEGSSNNKVLEFYNATGTEIDLAAGLFQVEFYFNGSTSAGSTIALTGVIADGGTHVLAHSSSWAEVLAVADQTAGGGWFNGDDAIVLRKGGTGGQILDSIGQVGFDPGSYWGTKPISTQDNTLRRRPDVCAGDTDPSDDFNPNLDAVTGEWDGYDQNTFDGLGTHESNCCPEPPGPAGPIDPNPENDAVTIATDVTTQSDLSITKSDTPDPVVAGQALSYELIVSNAGPSNAAGVVVVDTLPDYTDLVSYSVAPPGPTCSEIGGVVTCSLGEVGAPGQCQTSYPMQFLITINVVVDPKAPCSPGQCPGSPGEPLENTASVSDRNCLPDPDLSNNAAVEETEVLAGADVEIGAPVVFRSDGTLADESVEDGAACIGPGSMLTVQHTFGNTGPDAHSMQFNNPGPEFAASLPSQVAGKPGTCTVAEGNGTCSVTTGRVTWDGTMAVGEQIVLEYQVRVRGGVPFGTELEFAGTVYYDRFNTGTNNASRASESALAMLDCASIVDPNRQLGLQVHLPILNYLGNDDVCDTAIEVQALGAEPMKAVLVTWGEPGFCPPQAAGPLKVECSGLLKPGTSWIFYEAQVPTGSKGGMLFKFSTRKLSYYGLDVLFGFDDIFADLMCETLFFGVVGDSDDFRRFKQAYNDGNVFAGIPLDLAAGLNEGGVLGVEVVRSCPGNTTAGVKTTSKYNGIAGAHLGTYDPVYGGYGYYVPLVYADKTGFDSFIYIQNGGLECTSVEVWFKAQDDCLRARICDVSTLAPGETYQLDASDCVGPQWQGSAWIRTSQPAGIVVDLIGTDVLMTYIGEPEELNYTFDPEQPFASPGNQVAFGPLVYSEYQGWDTGVQVMNLSPVMSAKVKAYFLDRSGDVVTTLVDWVCPRGSQTFFLPVIYDLPGNWVGSIRIESQEWITPSGPLIEPPNIVGVATLIKYADVQRSETREAIAYNLLPEHKIFDWQVGGLGAGGLEGGVGLIAIPSLMKDLDGIGLTSELAIANVVPKPGFTDFAIYIFDQNGMLGYVCEKLNEKQVEYIDLQTWGYVNNSFKGSALISAVYWEHEVFEQDGFFVRNLLGLGAVAVERSSTRLGVDIAGDESGGSRGIPFRQSDIEDEEFAFAFMGDFPECPGVPSKRKEPGQLTATDMFISEYVEGSSNNKALEFYNGTDSAIDLAGGEYVVEVYFNGNFAAGSTILLSGSVSPGDVWVLADDESSTAVLALADQVTTQFLFNGNDAVVLRKGGDSGPIVDVIGEVGFDPGTQWGSGLISTQNATLRRRAHIVQGHDEPFEPFEPFLDPVTGEWNGFAQDTFDGLGWHVTD